MMSVIGERYKEKSTRPKTDPCGTPKVRLRGDDTVLLTIAADEDGLIPAVLEARYERNTS